MSQENVSGNHYDKYGTSNPVERAMMRGFFRSLEASLVGVVPSRVLEVGAGEGHVATWLVERYPAAAVVGLDLPDAALRAAWTSVPGMMLHADARRLPFVDNQFDLVVALEVLEHVDRPSAVIRELARVCSGTIVVSVPREPIWRVGNVLRGRYLRDWGNTPGHVQHWSARSFRRLVAADLDVVTVQKPLPWTMVSARPRP